MSSPTTAAPLAGSRGSLAWRLRPLWMALLFAVLAIVTSDAVAGHLGLALGAVCVLAPAPLLRWRGHSLTVSVLAVVATLVVAAVLITVLLHPLIEHIGVGRSAL